mmetsp:Transcript_17766/g.45941  ORF Transcript_17766/g.45941 Transcript_17766/m.45941 type:complete len:309 (+) Transcript_17766:146-1072(+)
MSAPASPRRRVGCAGLGRARTSRTDCTHSKSTRASSAASPTSSVPVPRSSASSAPAAGSLAEAEVATTCTTVSHRPRAGGARTLGTTRRATHSTSRSGTPPPRAPPCCWAPESIGSAASAALAESARLLPTAGGSVFSRSTASVRATGTHSAPSTSTRSRSGGSGGWDGVSTTASRRRTSTVDVARISRGATPADARCSRRACAGLRSSSMGGSEPSSGHTTRPTTAGVRTPTAGRRTRRTLWKWTSAGAHTTMPIAKPVAMLSTRIVATHTSKSSERQSDSLSAAMASWYAHVRVATRSQPARIRFG